MPHLVRHGFPPEWLPVFSFLLALRCPAAALVLIDAFAGGCNMSKAFTSRGLWSMPFDSQRDAYLEDCLSLAGCQYFLTMLARTAV